MEAPKKVLLITYYWPPAGGPGVQRWLKFVKYLPGYGVDPVVYIPENPSYPIIDEGLLSEVPANVTILRKNITEPYALAGIFSKNKAKKISSGIIPHKKKQSFVEKAMLWIRGNLFIPDARVLWVKPSVQFLSDYIGKNGIDTIVTSGPPHSLHLIGLGLKKENIRWIADFRDPWTTIGYHKELKLSAYAAKKHKKMEKQVMDSADVILVTSPTTRQEFQGITKTPIAVITNGFDVEKIAKQPLDEKFTMAHIGSLLSQRNPLILWESLHELTYENASFAADFSLKLIGAVSQEVLQSVIACGLEKFVDNQGYVSHDEAVIQQRSSQVLLLIEINSPDTRSIIPGKLFEYMASERPVIAIGPEGSDFAGILKETNTGTFFTYEEKQALKEKIMQHYLDYKEGRLASHPVGLQRYSRKFLTGELAKIIRS